MFMSANMRQPRPEWSSIFFPALLLPSLIEPALHHFTTPFTSSSSMSSENPFGEPPLVEEPFILGGIPDPVPWVDVEDQSLSALHFLLSQRYRFGDKAEVEVLVANGSRTHHTFHRLHGGVTNDEVTPLVGWVPEATMYIIASLGTEIRVIHEMQQCISEKLRCLPEIARAWYAYRLRASIISNIPAAHRLDTPPTDVYPECHGYVCWLARTSARLPHDRSGREDFMAAFPNATLDMYLALVTDLGSGIFYLLPVFFFPTDLL